MPVYDEPKQETADDLSHITGIGSDEEKAMDNAAHSGAAEDIGARENEASGGGGSGGKSGASGSSAGGGAASKSTPGKDLKAAEESGDSFYKPEGGKHRKQIKGKPGLGKKKAAGLSGAIVGSGLLFTLVMGSLGGGPLQLIYGAQGLLHAFSRQQSDTSNSRHHWIRDIKALRKGDFRYTRVGLIGAKWANDTFSDLEDAGVKFTGSDVLGRPTGMELDQEALAENNPEVKDMTPEEFDNWAADNFNVEATKVQDGKIDISGMSDQVISKSLKTARALTGNNGLISGLKARAVKKFWGLGDIFHPFSRALNNKIRARQAATDDGTKEEPDEEGISDAQDPETEVMETNTETEIGETSTTVDTNVQDIESAANDTGRTIANWTGLGQGQLLVVGCTMQSGANAIIAIDRFGTVLPAIEMAMRLMGMAAQIQSGGSDISLEQVGGTVSGFTATAQSDKDNGVTDAGTNIWDGGALGTLLGSQTPSSSGDVPGDITIKRKSAFNPPNVSGVLKLASGLITASFLGFSWVPDKCGWGGTIAQFVLGAIEQGVIGLINIPDAETATAPTELGFQLVVRQLVAKVIGVAEGAGVGLAEGYVLNQVKDIIVNSHSAKQLAADAFTGTQGGDLIAYGARAGANLLSASSGGIMLANTATTTLLGSVGQQEQQSFEQEPMFARLFDINDDRSLVGHLALDMMPLSTNYGMDISSIFGSVLGAPGSLPSSLLSMVSGSTYADASSDSWTGNYNWGFGQYGVPTAIQNADDPASSAEDLGKYLTNVCPNGPTDGQCAGDTGFTNRILVCFGSNLTQDGGLWDVTAASTASASTPVDIDPGNPTYQSADCQNANNGGITVCKNDNDTSPGCIWGRVLDFVNDVGTLKALACATEDTSCDDIGAPTETHVKRQCSDELQCATATIGGATHRRGRPCVPHE